MSTSLSAPMHDRRDFTSPELAFLVAWGRDQCLEVEIVPEGSDFADEVAFIGLSHKLALWTIHRADGTLWLTWLAKDRTRAVRTVAEACVRIDLAVRRGVECGIRSRRL